MADVVNKCFPFYSCTACICGKVDMGNNDKNHSNLRTAGEFTMNWSSTFQCSHLHLGDQQHPWQETGNTFQNFRQLQTDKCTCAARSEPARSIMKRRAKRTSCNTSRHRLCCLTATCSTAWERDDVWLAAVGSWVRCLLPFTNNSMIWEHIDMCGPLSLHKVWMFYLK